MKFGSITTPIVTDGLIFNMDAANRASYPRTGTTVTDTIGNSSGTLTNGVSFNNNNKGVFGFDGLDDYIDIPDTEIFFDSTQPFSCSVWCKVNSYSSPQYPALFLFKTDQSTGFVLFLSHTGSYKGINFGSNNNFLRRLAGDENDIPINTWMYIVLTYDGVSRTASSSYKVYLNGMEKTQVNSGLYATCPNENNIGVGNTTSTWFNGQIGPFHIYNHTLSDSEILHNYNALKSRFGL